MIDTLAVAAVGLVGVVLGAGAVLAFRVSERAQQRLPAQPEPVVPPGVSAVLSVLRSSAVVVDVDDLVLKASAPAHALGLVRGDRLQAEELLELVRQVRRDGQIREQDLVLGGDGHRPATHVGARIAPLGSRLVLALVEDQTRERQVEAIRRDFVANVSHELKTPIGALSLLSEAVGEAADDPAAVVRFSRRMHTEAERLTRLVQQIIELSRLQEHDPLSAAAPVDLDHVVEVAMDRARVDAQDKGVTVVRDGERGLWVAGSVDQLSLAVSNLVENAITYSADGASVVISVFPEAHDAVRITVTDRGIGIPADELNRIFERFYRVDPARARSTGGTGLGLSIVKHVVAVHGGEVRVRSVEGQGSSFTLSLPNRVDRPRPGPAEAPEAPRRRADLPQEAGS